MIKIKQAMSKKKDQKQNVGVENVEQALTRSEQFIENNQKMLTRVLLVIVIVIGGIIGFKNLYLKPKEIEANASIFHAEMYFEKDSFELALNEMGTSNYYGFLDVIDEYGLTKTANRAKYCAGICYLRLGYYEEAIEYLKKFRGGNKNTSVFALGSIGDAYVELQEYKMAVDHFLKAAKKIKNEYSTPKYYIKAATVYKELDEYEKALNLYQKIKTDFPNSREARDIEKHITWAKLNLGV